MCVLSSKGIVVLTAWSGLLLILSGCSVGMALSSSRGPDLQAIQVGSARETVEAELGSPVSSVRNPDGGRTTHHDYVLHKEANADRALTHALFDVLTVGLWELGGTYMEWGAGTRCRSEVDYTPDDRVVAIRHIGCTTVDACFSCLPGSTWQTAREVTPITYRSSDVHLKRSVGMLRRLGLVPARGQERLGADQPSKARGLLSNWKGYEVVPLELYENILLRQLNMSAEEVNGYLDALVRWAKESPDGAVPPGDLIRAVARLGRALNVDGLLVIHADGGKLAADIYEVATGRIVWRGRRRDDLSPGVMGQLFQRLEQAVPRAMVEE